MIRFAYIGCILLLVTLAIPGSGETSGALTGTASAGYVFLDEDGNRSVLWTTRNLYDGLILSFDELRYDFANGMRLQGDLQNITSDNRNLILRASKPGHGAVTLRHRQFRRIYDFQGDTFTKRRTSSGSFWWQAHQAIRLFGGFGLTDKAGESTRQFGFDPGEPVATDYRRNHYHGGLTLSHQRSRLTASVRLSDFDDHLGSADDRFTKNWRVSASSPVPRYDFIKLNAGVDRYRALAEQRADTLIATTGWGGVRIYPGQGYNLRYSVIFNRARRTGDIVASDNIANLIVAGRTWSGVGGVEIGYRHEINDDLFDELSTTGVMVDSWYRPIEGLTLRFGMGTEQENVESGKNLTGTREKTRHKLSARYRAGGGMIRLQYQSRQVVYDDIDSRSDYGRVSGDILFKDAKWGEVALQVSYSIGEFENSGGMFEYREQQLHGSYTTPEYRGLAAELGGMLLRGKRDVDIEASVVRLGLSYQILPRLGFECDYSAHNYDDYDNLATNFTDFYTANVFEFRLVRDL